MASKEKTIEEFPFEPGIDHPFEACVGPYAYLRDNKDIHKGYRLGLSTRQVFRSLFQIHNETVNIWSHLIGVLFFIYLFVHVGLNRTGEHLHSVYHFDQPSSSVSTTEAQPPFLVMKGIHTPAMMVFLSDVAGSTSVAVEHTDGYYKVADIILERMRMTVYSLQELQDILPSLSLGHSKDGESINSYVEEVGSLLGRIKDTLYSAASSSSFSEKPIDKLHQEFEDAVSSMKSQLQDSTHGVADYALDEYYLFVNTMRNWVQAMKTGRFLSANKAFSILQHHYFTDIDEEHEKVHLSRWPIFVFVFTAILCLLSSTIFHWLSCRSKSVFDVVSKCDYGGISLLIAGSSVPPVFYGLYCQPIWIKVYFSGLVGFCTLGIAVSFLKKFSTSSYRKYRVLVYVLSGFASGAPLFHMFASFGFYSDEVAVCVWYIFAMAVCYLVGATIYLYRIPECFFPGKFDYAGSSHNIWHVFVFSAALVHYFGVVAHYNWRRVTPCVE